MKPEVLAAGVTTERQAAYSYGPTERGPIKTLLMNIGKFRGKDLSMGLKGMLSFRLANEEGALSTYHLLDEKQSNK